MKSWRLILRFAVSAAAVLGWFQNSSAAELPPRPPGPGAGVPSKSNASAAVRETVAYRIALSPHAGAEKLDEQIQQTQQRIREAPDPLPQLERLGWLFVAKARASHDAGFYKLAEQCAQALQSGDAKNPDALLLRGHVLQSLHRFKEAEAIGRELVAQRELAFDYGLLGDALVDQGKLAGAVEAYQKMIDLRPDLQSYSRVAHLRWLKGDLKGAIEVARRAAQAGSSLDPESTAWAWTRLGNYLFQDGELAAARTACASALEVMKDYPAALLLRGRMLLADGQAVAACGPLRIAARISPLPEYQWALAEAFRAAGETGEAGTVEAELRSTGATGDPRTFALFLATCGGEKDLALNLAERELQERADIFTYDALAWALFAAGRPLDAWPQMQSALAEGTKDARLFHHAGMIAARLGRTDEARKYCEQAHALQALLLPSERAQLTANLASLDAPPTKGANGK